MAAWTPEDLDRIARAEELEIAGRRADGEDLYVRSVYGPRSAWYRGVQAHHEGRIAAGGVTREVTVEDVVDGGVNERVDDAYRAKYGHYAQHIIDSITGETARATTLHITPSS